jgi:hypothetical protein
LNNIPIFVDGFKFRGSKANTVKPWARTDDYCPDPLGSVQSGIFDPYSLHTNYINANFIWFPF